MKAILCTLLLFFAVGIFSACDSKTVESSPESVESVKETLNNREAAKKKLDSRLNVIENWGKKTSDVLGKIKALQNKREKDQSYSQLDFLLDITTEIKNENTIRDEKKEVRFTEVTIPISTLSESCRTAIVKFESKIEAATGVESGLDPQAVEQYSYSVKTCTTDEKFLNVFKASISETSDSAGQVSRQYDFDINNKNMNLILSSIGVKAIEGTSNCKTVTDTEDQISEISCGGLQSFISKTELAIVDVNYNMMSDARFVVHADVYQVSEILVKKWIADVTVFANGKVDPRIIRVNSNDSLATAK
ncbi:MAG: hypothetical protein AB7O96_08835 [Pseudobdellovibrionaceae bacterium]